MKNTMKKLLSLLLVSVMLFGGTIMPMQTPVAATAYPSNQALTYSLYNVAVETYIGDFALENCYFVELYSGGLCVYEDNLLNALSPITVNYYITGINISMNVPIPYVSRSHLLYEFAVCNSYGYINLVAVNGFIDNNDTFVVNDIPLSLYDDLSTSPVDPTPDGMVFPEWYDFDRDRYSFENIDETIAIEYYTGMFGEKKGKEIYKFKEKGNTHGHCYGMALTTAATLSNAPDVSTYMSWAIVPYTKLKSVNQGTINTDLDMSAKDYIKYGQVYQFSSSATIEVNNNINDVEGLIAAVKDYLKGGPPVIILFDEGIVDAGPGGHAVYAIGMDGNDILVNDSNEPNTITKIKIEGNIWSYSGGGLTWKSSDSIISFSYDILSPYIALKNSIKVQGARMPSSEAEEIIGCGDRYAVGIPIIDENLNLITDSNDSFYFTQMDSMFELKNMMNSDAMTIEQNGTLYWLTDGYTIDAQNISSENAIVKVTGDELAISANIPANAQTEITVDAENENEISVQCNKNELSVITFSTVSDDGKFVDTVIDGTASGDIITAKQTETGLLVTGISDGTVTLSKDDEVIATQTVSNAISDIKITYDKTGTDENIAVEYEQPEVPTDPEIPTEPEDPTAPETPAEPDNSCSCLCHSENSFMQFIYTILRFFWQLFGMNMDCACGAKHFDSYFFA